MKRTEKLEALVGKKCDTILIVNGADRPDYNLEYYSGADATLTSGAVFWKVGKEPTLVCRDTKQKKKVKVIQKKDKDTLYKELRKKRPKKIGVNMEYVSVNGLKRMKKKTGAKFVDISKELKQVRAIKEKAEQKRISKACDETRKALKKLEISGRYEADVYSDIVSSYAKRALQLAYDPIVASGKNTQLIHSFPTRKRIGKSDAVIIDTGCRYEGYCSDITITHCEKPDAKTEEMLLTVYGANKLAQREARPGMKAKELCEIVKDYFGKYSKYWTYGLGHGIGLEVHEGLSLSLESESILEKGMVFTLEPGLIGPGQGARVEHTGVLRAKGFKIL